MANATPPNGHRAEHPQVGFTLTPERRLSNRSWSVPADEVPAAAAKLEAEGWRRIPTCGRLDYARFTGFGATIIVYHSGLCCVTEVSRSVTATGGAR